MRTTTRLAIAASPAIALVLLAGCDLTRSTSSAAAEPEDAALGRAVLDDASVPGRALAAIDGPLVAGALVDLGVVGCRGSIGVTTPVQVTGPTAVAVHGAAATALVERWPDTGAARSAAAAPTIDGFTECVRDHAEAAAASAGHVVDVRRVPLTPLDRGDDSAAVRIVAVIDGAPRVQLTSDLYVVRDGDRTITIVDAARDGFGDRVAAIHAVDALLNDLRRVPGPTTTTDAAGQSSPSSPPASS